jgi:hypothetical protein
MPQGILPFDIEVTGNDEGVTARAGLPLVLETMRALGVDKAIEGNLKLSKRDAGYGETAKVEALVLLMAAGGDCLDDIAVLKADAGLGRLLGRELPSADVLRRFLYAFHDPRLIEAAEQARAPGAVAYIPKESGPLEGLGRVNVALVQALSAQGKLARATLDHDASVVESHKAEARAHYKGGRGYQPAVMYWAEQDVVVGDEFRDGNVPAGMSNLPLIQRGFVSLPASVRERYFRADSACYEEQVLKWLADEQRSGGPAGFIGFSISADMSAELKAACAAVPDHEWKPIEERTGESVYAAEVEFAPGNWSKNAAPLRYVAVKFVGKQLELDGKPQVKHLAVVSNRREMSAEELLRWHWEKAGTIEHVHDVVKNELGGGVMPCGRFGSNAAWFRLALLTYNVLSAMKSLALPPSMSSARPKRLRFLVLNLAARVSTHAGRLLARIGQAVERVAQLVAARLRLGRMLPAAAAG